MDFLLDEQTRDIVWRNGPLTKDQTTQPLIDTVRQRLLILLRSYQGEWFLDTTYGIPYYQSILGRKTTKDGVDLIFQTAILSENGVKEITSFSSTFIQRQYSMTFSVRVNDGQITAPITI